VSAAARLRAYRPWLVSLAVAIAAFAYLLSQIEIEQLQRAVRNLSPVPLGAYVLLTAVGVLARSGRFWLLLGRTVPFRQMIGITLVRNLFVDLLPARTGELSYVYMLARVARRPVEEGIATLMLAFMLDLVALGPLLCAAALTVPAGGLSTGWLVVAAIVFTGAGVASILLLEPAARAVRAILTRRSSPRLHGWAHRFEGAAQAFERCRRTGAFVPLLAISLVVRLCKFGGYYALVMAVILPMGYALEGIAPLRVFLGVLAAEITASLPIHGIAGFGTFELAWAFSFEQLGFPRQHAIVSGIVAHAVSQLVEYSAGAVSLMILLRPRRDAGDRPGDGSAPSR
jgi:uncharacterized protein (TIRG00374 family)